ncbi:MAG: hypothetical protein R3F53_18280 [Gammaproteobacteria bacterium]
MRREQKALHDEEIAPGLRLATDGIYSTFPDDPIKDVWLTPEERAILAEHPKKDLSKPVLAFPATPREFESFIKNEGLTCREWIENYRAWLLKHAPDLVEFPVAQEALEARYDACAEEIALWVYHSELTAYEDDSVLRYPTADLLEDPQTTQLIDQHDFPNTDDPKHDLLTVLNELYFDRAQIKNFKPQTRWLNF